MSTSIMTLQYGSFAFDFYPKPQVGIRQTVKHIGESGTGPVTRANTITIKGKIVGDNFNAIQTKVWALDVAFAKQGQTLLFIDGTTTRINQTAHVDSLEIPADWQQYSADYTITLTYIPLGETQYAPVSVTYNGYTFSPIPAIGRDYRVQRESADSARISAKTQVTLQGVINKGTVAANLTEWNLLLAALAGDGTFAYGGFSQSCKVVSLSHTPDLTDRQIVYTVTLEYDSELSGAGIKRMSSQRRIQNFVRAAKSYVPFQDDANLQILGRGGQTIALSGFIVGNSMANARSAAATEIAAQFPSTDPDDYVEEQTDITEKSAENRVEWSITRFYPVPVLTGGIYGGSAIY